MLSDFKDGPRVNPDAPPGCLEAKQPWIDNGVDVAEPSRYYSAEFMALEWERLWPRVWLLAGVSSDIPRQGDYFLFDIGRESIICVRTQRGIKAFFNVCSHRGSRLLLEERGRRNRFVCPFHSWRYANTGELLAITDRETFREQVICHNPGLTELAVAEKAGLVFVNMDPDPMPFETWYGLPDGYLEGYGIDRMHVVRHVQTEWRANWKIGVEAFYETYHLHQVHPETRYTMADLRVQCDLYPNGCSRMIVPIGLPSPRMRDQESLNDDLRGMLMSVGVDPGTFQGTAQDVRPAIARAKRRLADEKGVDYSHLTDGQLTDSWATGLFPNVQIGCHPEGVFVMRFLPHPTDPERFFYDTMTLFMPVDDANPVAPAWMGIPDGTDLTGRTRPAREYFGVGEDANLGQVLSQDSELLPVVQAGVRSRAFKGQLWSEQEQRLRHFHVELERFLSKR